MTRFTSSPAGVVASGNALLDRQLRELTDRVRELQSSVLADSVLVTDISLTASAQAIGHGLGRVPRGFLVVRRDANTVVYEPSVADSPRRDINLAAGSPTVCDILFF